ncbi:hypothetical protein BHE74_00045356 [Ensete ventricosum]|nr:hypothetical protein GW17_00035650 [Ensete ventricosum]RWW48555.1 hypothetical protein BHE74_00045356 [Ensete ventricosum]
MVCLQVRRQDPLVLVPLRKQTRVAELCSDARVCSGGRDSSTDAEVRPSVESGDQSRPRRGFDKIGKPLAPLRSGRVSVDLGDTTDAAGGPLRRGQQTNNNRRRGRHGNPNPCLCSSLLRGDPPTLATVLSFVHGPPA